MRASAQKDQYVVPVQSDDAINSASVLARRVLLVDEQAHVLRVMRVNLDRHGYEVDTALSASNALQLLREQAYDALIVTSSVPDMSGRELYEMATQKSENSLQLVLICANDDNQWIDSSTIAEQLDRPISLRWVVARLGEIFGDYERG